MTDPERISRRSSGLAAELLRAGTTEEPTRAGVERTLAALGVSGAILTTASAASAGTAAGAGAAATAVSGAKAVKAVSSLLLVKWIGVGVVSGVGLAGVAAVVSEPAPAPVVAPAAVVSAPPALVPQPSIPVAPAEVVAALPAPAPATAAVSAAPSSVGNVAPSDPEMDLGAPLAAEVAFIDRARASLASGQAAQGLSQLASYEQSFPEARLLPEVLFLRLDACERLGRHEEARVAAERLVQGFPKSPHAARARKLLAR